MLLVCMILKHLCFCHQETDNTTGEIHLIQSSDRWNEVDHVSD